MESQHVLLRGGVCSVKQPGSSLILTVSRKRIGEWGLRDGAKVPVSIGHLHGVAVVHQVEAEEERASLRWSGGWLDWQRDGLAGRMTHTQERGVRIGPVIGIMTTGLRDDLHKPVGGRTELLGEFVRAAREMTALCFLFNACDIDWAKGTVRGATLVGPRGKEVWKFYQFPLPEVVYNRVPHRSAEVSDEVRQCKIKLAQHNIPLFNERFINKREMYNWLLDDARTNELIPVTDRLRTGAGLERFCREHPLVYLKPTGGSLGMGILKVQRKQGQFHVRYRRQKEHLTAKFARGEELLRFVKTTNPNRIYLMQQGIRLMSYQGNPTDFRVHLHKNGAGNWEAAGIGAKVAGRGAVTTHVHNGGKVLSGDKVLSEWYGANAANMREKMVEASVRVAEVLEGYLAGSSGEWGLDVGIDIDGRVWVFEANAKPGRAIFRHPELRDAGKRSARMVVEYAASLAGYPLTRG